jgi:hypothetical protein
MNAKYITVAALGMLLFVITKTEYFKNYLSVGGTSPSPSFDKVNFIHPSEMHKGPPTAHMRADNSLDQRNEEDKTPGDREWHDEYYQVVEKGP